MSIIDCFERDAVVSSPQLRTGLFTTGQVENIYHNPSSITSTDSFHGTAHSLCQHPNENNRGTKHDPIVIDDKDSEKQVPPLSVAYLLLQDQ